MGGAGIINENMSLSISEHNQVSLAQIRRSLSPRAMKTVNNQAVSLRIQD